MYMQMEEDMEEQGVVLWNPLSNILSPYYYSSLFWLQGLNLLQCRGKFGLVKKGLMVACHIVPTKFPKIIASLSFPSLNFDGSHRGDADEGGHARAREVCCCPIVPTKFPHNCCIVAGAFAVKAAPPICLPSIHTTPAHSLQLLQEISWLLWNTSA